MMLARIRPVVTPAEMLAMPKNGEMSRIYYCVDLDRDLDFSTPPAGKCAITINGEGCRVF